MSREIAVCTTGTGSATAILCWHSQWCRSVCLAKWWCVAGVQEAMAATIAALPISLAVVAVLHTGCQTFLVPFQPNFL